MSEQLSEREKRLLRQQAEAYAFIQDLRDMARFIGNTLVVQRTEGIEETIERRRKEYPTLFQRYFNEAYKRGARERLKALQEKKDGQREALSRRQEKTPKKETKADSKPKRRTRRPRKKKKTPKSVTRRKPE